MAEGTSRERPSTRPRRALKRVAALALGAFLAFALLELGLQLASLFVRGDRPVAAGGDVICQGDSNTYGLHLPAEHAWPAQLEALLGTSSGELRSVANLGVPGKTSWVVAQQLPEDLERYTARALVVWCGVNDFSERRPEGAGLADRLRSVKLLRRFLASFEQSRLGGDAEASAAGEDLRSWRAHLVEGSVQQLDAERHELRFTDRTNVVRPMIRLLGTPDPAEAEHGLYEDLLEIVATARASGSTPLLVCYPLDSVLRFNASNRAVVRAAEESGARLVDLRPAFAEALTLVAREEVLFEDGHPTRLGYSIVARLVWTALVAEGLATLDAPIDPLAEVRAWSRPELALEALVEDGKLVGLRARFEAGHRVQFVVSESAGETPVRWSGVVVPVSAERSAHTLPLALGELAKDCLKRPARYLVPVGADGKCEVRFHDELQARVDAGGELWGSAVLVNPGQRIGAIADALRLR